MHSSRLDSSMGASVIMLSLTHWQRVSKKAGGDVPSHKFNCSPGIEYMASSTCSRGGTDRWGTNHRKPRTNHEIHEKRRNSAEVTYT